jgi:hypothetical protein
VRVSLCALTGLRAQFRNWRRPAAATRWSASVCWVGIPDRETGDLQGGLGDDVRDMPIAVAAAAVPGRCRVLHRGIRFIGPRLQSDRRRVRNGQLA